MIGGTSPEAVALAEILTDLDWRRHVATVPDWQDQGVADTQ